MSNLESLPGAQGHVGINGTAGLDPARPPTSAEALRKLAELKGRLATAFSQVTMALMQTPRYRHLSIADLQWLVLEPLLRDRIAIASAKPASEAEDAPVVGLAIWARVSDAVGRKIEEQVKAGTFPVRLQPDEWNSGETIWLLDVIAANKELATKVLASFGQLAKASPVSIHPMVSRVVDQGRLRSIFPRDATA